MPSARRDSEPVGRGADVGHHADQAHAGVTSSYNLVAPPPEGSVRGGWRRNSGLISRLLHGGTNEASPLVARSPGAGCEGCFPGCWPRREDDLPGGVEEVGDRAACPCHLCSVVNTDGEEAALTSKAMVCSVYQVSGRLQGVPWGGISAERVGHLRPLGGRGSGPIALGAGGFPGEHPL